LLESEEFFYPFLDEGMYAAITPVIRDNDQKEKTVYHDTGREESTVHDVEDKYN
jgi:hypothetical protein